LIRVLCDGFATRLAQLQAESPPPLDSGKYSASVQINNRIFEAARVAHIPARNQQTQRYGYGNMVSMALPNVIPDSWYSNHDQRVLEFIRGENKKIAYICSGLVASLLQAWSVAFFGKIGS
ncbi:hypothetical protein, partial [Massilia genomosp. 1]|uniref:hypothetical protein n=1 Tax=Massilia genomosp. 1 TaxID=2609280 RepID=UPI00141F0A21